MNAPVGGVAVITGGASGIGLALARAFGGQGRHVVIADLDEVALTKAAADLESSGVSVDTQAVDVRDASTLVAVADLASSRGQITTVCMNAGVTSTGNLLWDTPEEGFDFVTAVNLKGLFNSIRAFIPRLVDQGTPASVVVTASMAGMTTSAYSATYSASKAGAIALAKALRAEVDMVAPFLSVSVLNPGMVKTNLIRTSAAHLPAAAALSPDLIEGGHVALNEAGVAPDEAAQWVLDAVERGDFWILPSADDPFTEILRAELDQLEKAIADS